MSTISEILEPILDEALGIASLQFTLQHIECPSEKKAVIMSWYERDFISSDQAILLIEHNQLEAA